MTTRLTRTEAERRTRLAKQLAAHDQTREAMTRGAVLPQQAVVISKAVDALDNTQHRDAAEAHLIKEAGHFDAHKLAELGRRILETVDPDKADAHEAKLLEKQEARAAKKTQFRLYDDGEGLSHGRFTMPTAQAAMLRKALQALAAPKHVRATEGAGSYDYEKPTPEKLGKAFCEYVERYPADKLPVDGWHQRHHHRDRRRRDAARRVHGCAPRHRPRDLTRAATPLGVRGEDPARRPGRPIARPRPRPLQALPHRSAADWPCRSSSRPASTPPATPPARSATPTTTPPGARAGSPTPGTPRSCARSTTTKPTPPERPTRSGPDGAQLSQSA